MDEARCYIKFLHRWTYFLKSQRSIILVCVLSAFFPCYFMSFSSFSLVRCTFVLWIHAHALLGHIHIAMNGSRQQSHWDEQSPALCQRTRVGRAPPSSCRILETAHKKRKKVTGRFSCTQRLGSLHAERPGGSWVAHSATTTSHH